MAVNKTEAKPLELKDFEAILLSAPFKDMGLSHKVAVGLSGGADSLLLTKMLSLYAEKHQNLEIEAIIIDHGLRPEAKKEAQDTRSLVKDWPCVRPRIVALNLGEISTSVQEKARKARYAVFERVCAEEDIRYLFLGHHADDQMETFLFRLSKGSGLDGLTCMDEIHETSDGFFLVRPFLEVTKEEILASCEKMKLKFMNDPSNQNEKFVRTRFRASKKLLQNEGFCAKNMSATIKRLSRVQKTIQVIANDAEKTVRKNKETGRIVYDLILWRSLPLDVAYRVILQGVNCMSSRSGFGPRTSKFEDLFECLRSDRTFRTRTLYGLKFTRDDERGEVVIQNEKI